MIAVAQPRSSLYAPAAAMLRLASRPGCLLALLLALNALARPYGNLAHDARLYSVQVLNQLEGGAFSDDLFLRYGSQDQFSIFSRIASPLAAVLGLPAAFFVLYVAFTAIFYWALMRFVCALVPDRLVAVLALVYLAVAPLPFGGLNIFLVHESFLTPRILANALVLLALERTLKERYGSALALLVPAMLVHPLMAFGGVLVWAGCLAAARLNRATLIAVIVALAAVGIAVLAWEPLGVRVFGAMDMQWRDMVRDASAYNFPDEWTRADWSNLAVCLAVIVWSAVAFPQMGKQRRRLLCVTLVVGIVGVCATALAADLPYALLFQGQPYRVLWILKVLQVPLGFWLIRRWAASTMLPRQLTALGLLFYFSLTTFVGVELVVPFFVLPIVLLRAWALEYDLTKNNRWWRLAAVSIIAGACLWAAFKWLLLIVCREQMFERLDALGYSQRLIDHLGAYFWIVLSAWFAMQLLATRRSTAAVGTALALLALAYQTVLFVIPNAPLYREGHTRFGADIAFARDFLARHRQPGAPLPTVYSDWGRIDYVWVDLHSKSYFDWAQVVGVLFSRQTAAEGRRRAAMVAPFEIDRFREDEMFITDTSRESMSRLYQTDLDCPAPTVADVARLCREPGLDYLILKHEFAGLVTAGNGNVFIYDCQQVRAALALPGARPEQLAETRMGPAETRAAAAP
jgi:hypothetical protein